MIKWLASIIKEKLRSGSMKILLRIILAIQGEDSCLQELTLWLFLKVDMAIINQSALMKLIWSEMLSILLRTIANKVDSQNPWLLESTKTISLSVRPEDWPPKLSARAKFQFPTEWICSLTWLEATDKWLDPLFHPKSNQEPAATSSFTTQLMNLIDLTSLLQELVSKVSSQPQKSIIDSFANAYFKILDIKTINFSISSTLNKTSLCFMKECFWHFCNK